MWAGSGPTLLYVAMFTVWERSFFCTISHENCDLLNKCGSTSLSRVSIYLQLVDLTKDLTNLSEIDTSYLKRYGEIQQTNTFFEELKSECLLY